MIRTIDEIRRAGRGPRPIPPIETPRTTITPPCVDTVLSNGLRVLLVRHASVPTVHLRVMIPFAGTDPRHAARAALLTHTLFAGTSRRNRLVVDADTARIGGNVGAVVTPERLGIAGMSLTSGLATLLDVMVDAITDATYPENEVNRERDRIIQRLAMDRAEPAILAREALQRHRYGDHPITRELPDPAHVAALDPTEIRTLHHTAVVPRGAVLLLVGDIDLDQALADVERATRGWSSPTTAHHLPPLPTPPSDGLQMVHLPGAVQSHLRLSAPAVPYTDPRYPALCLATLALGGGHSARLFEVIREKKAYCYSANSALEFTQDTAGVNATVNVAMNTATETTRAALDTLHDELARFVAEPPDDAELDRIRRYAVGAQLTATMSQARLANILNGLVNCGLGVDWLATERERLGAVTVDDLAEAARDFFDPARFTGVLVGNTKVLGSTVHTP